MPRATRKRSKPPAFRQNLACVWPEKRKSKKERKKNRRKKKRKTKRWAREQP